MDLGEPLAVTAGERIPFRRDGSHRDPRSGSWAGMRSRRLPRDRVDVLLLAAIATAAVAVRAVPVLIGGGLLGRLGYDDGVYFAAASAFVHGVVPYRDFLLLHPPGIVLTLAPLAMIGTLTGDPSAFALARISIMLLGAVNAILIALVAGRYSRLGGLIAGALYAVWSTTAIVERSTDLHGPQGTLLLIGLLVMTHPGRFGPRRAAVIGVALGLATAVQLWQGVSVVVVLWWVIVRARGHGWGRLRPALAYVAGAGIAFGLVCLPFLVAAPEALIRYTLIDQLGRPDQGIDTIQRLRVLEGLQSVPILRHPVPDPLVLAAAAIGIALVIVTAWRCVWTRPWAILAIVQLAVVLSTPSFHDDYPSFVAPAALPAIGTGLAAVAWVLARRGLRPIMARVAVLALIMVLAAVSLAHREGSRLPLADLERDVSSARCVTADAPSLLVLTSAMQHNLDAGCPLVVDPSGVWYDTDRGRVSRRDAPGYQQAMVAWYTSGDVALFLSEAGDGLAPATEAAIQQRLPVERHLGNVTVRLAPPP
ncbi:MAG TPA: hypothetical protein VIK13_09260 [Candidatus Limnocylindrales bacterium]